MKKAKVSQHVHKILTYFAERWIKGNEYEGKKYNVHCESYVKGYGMLQWYLMMEEDAGEWIEKGLPVRNTYGHDDQNKVRICRREIH